MDIMGWKPTKIYDPIVTLSNLQLSKDTTKIDRFNHYPSANLLHNDIDWSNSQAQTIKTTNSVKQTNYLNLLNLTCKVSAKKPVNKNSYRSKINRSGYLLEEEIQSVISDKNEQIKRKIVDNPYRILNAPKLKDDFYTNLLDWGFDDTVGVVLDNAAYVWNSKDCETEKIIEGYISSLNFNKRGLILGEETGRVRVVDIIKKKQVARHRNHYSRVGALDSYCNLIASGSKDNSVLVWDLRTKSITKRLQNHRQEVCGVKWSFDGNYIASGGNDNTVYVWDQRSNKVFQKFNEHTAAIKALAWSPHQNGTLATGGGSTDKTIRIWNINEGICTKKIDTGSQVCNMLYSQNSNELVSTHGFSLNSIHIWDGKSLDKVGTLRGHSFRVLYLAKSPDGQSIVTGSGDQTLRFWKLFPSSWRSLNGGCLEPKNISLR